MLQISRRSFILKSLGCGVAGSVAILSACESASFNHSRQSFTDWQVAHLLASIEVPIVITCQQIRNGIQFSRLRDAPPSLPGYLTLAQSHHQAHLDRWNEVLVIRGRQMEMRAHPSLAAALLQATHADDVLSALTAARHLVEVSVATYVEGTQWMHDAELKRACCRIAAVEAEHFAILSLLMGSDPLADDFGTQLALVPK